MNRFAAVLAAALLAAITPSHAEIETVRVETRKGPAERWWPKLTPPKGWHHDRDHSLNYNLNAIAPVGESFASAEAILYGRAVRKASDSGLKSVADFIERERRSFLRRTPGYDVREGAPVLTRDGMRMRTFDFAPKADGNWERVAYGEDNDHYLLFVLSARSKKALDQAVKPWQSMVWSFRRGP